MAGELVHYDDSDSVLPEVDYYGVTEHRLDGQAQGDIIYYNGTSLVRLAPGTSGYPLITSGAAANPSWAKLTWTGIDSTTADATFASLTSTSTVTLDAGSSHSPILYLTDGDDKSLLIQKSDTGHAYLFNDEGEIRIIPSNDASDYIRFLTTADVPQIDSVGGSDMKITCDSGTINFDNEHLKTTGNLTDGTNTLTVANAKTAYDHSQVVGGNSVHVSVAENTNWDTAYTHAGLIGNPHLVTLNVAYDGGATITVDDAGGDLIFNLTEAADFIVKDNGTAFFTLTDSGQVDINAPATLDKSVDWAQTSTTTTSATYGTYWQRDWLPTSDPSGVWTLFGHHFGLDAQRDIVGGGGAMEVYFFQTLVLKADNHTDLAAGTYTGAHQFYTQGLYGWAKDYGGDVSNQTNKRYISGLDFITSYTGTINNADCDLTVYNRGIYVNATTNPVITDGTFTAYTYGAYLTATGTTEGTQEAYGIYAYATNADTNYGGYFKTNSTNAAGSTGFFLQDSLTGACPVITLDQDDISEEFERYVGSAAAATLTQSLVAAGDVGTATVVGYKKVYVVDEGDQIADGPYYEAIYSLAA